MRLGASGRRTRTAGLLPAVALEPLGAPAVAESRRSSWRTGRGELGAGRTDRGRREGREGRTWVGRDDLPLPPVAHFAPADRLSLDRDGRDGGRTTRLGLDLVEAVLER
jgi:hypothetical protein